MAAIARREHAAGRLDVWAVQRMLDRDFGDAKRAERLERRADSLRRQLAGAAQLMAPERAPEDPLEAASRCAHQVFTEVTRQKMADAQAGRSEPRPFASAGPSAAAECTGPDCPVCTAYRSASGDALAPYAPGDVITTGYTEVYR